MHRAVIFLFSFFLLPFLLLFCLLDEWDAVREAIDNAEHARVIVIVANRLGVQLVHAKGRQEIDEFMGVASASKIVAGSIIMRLVEQGRLNLFGKASDYLDYWTTDPTDLRSNVTVQNLLSFTSGFRGEHPCLFRLGPTFSLQECARDIYDGDNMFGYAPDSTFYYSSNHLQIAGAIAEVASGLAWQDLFDAEFRRPLNLSQQTVFVGGTNPGLAFSLETSPEEYNTYFNAYYNYQYLSYETTRLMEGDWTPTSAVTMAFQPNNWGKHYGLVIVFSSFFPQLCVCLFLTVAVYNKANWFECLGAGDDAEEAEWREECLQEDTHASKGANGFFPVVDRFHDYYFVIGT